MTAHRITYEGPVEFAMEAATALADAEGVELRSANRPEPFDGQPDRVRLALSVEGDPADVVAAVRAVGGGLPAGAGLALEVQ